MGETDMKNIVDHQFKMQLKEKGMTTHDLSNLEEMQWKYDIAIKMLIEL